MIIATWNVFSGTTAENANALLEKFDADIIAFQETSNSVEPGSVWHGDPGKKNKGVSLWSKMEFDHLAPAPNCSPAISATFHDTPLGPLNILNLWAKPSYFEDMMSSLESYREFIQQRPTIILGDFNISPRLKAKRKQFHTLNSILEDEFHMRSAYHSKRRETLGMETMTTLYFQWGTAGCYHCDFIYVPVELIPRIKSVKVPGYKSFSTSDHRPIVCEFK